MRVRSVRRAAPFSAIAARATRRYHRLRTRELQRIQVALKAFVLDGDRLRMVREADGERYWELLGGRIEVGEENVPPAAVLRRELSEELGAAFVYEVDALVTAWVRPPDPPRRSVPVFLLGYSCRPGGGEIALGEEQVEHRWVTRAECAQLQLAPGYAAALDTFWLGTGQGK
jgi:8-oxo-dGTP pyrophosphatase MutT (NUDIX family)